MLLHPPAECQLAKRHHHLGNALGILTSIGVKAPIQPLQSTQAGKPPVHGGTHRCLFSIPRQRLKGHGGGIRLGAVPAGQVPAAVRQLAGKNGIHIHLPGGLGGGGGIPGDLILPASSASSAKAAPLTPWAIVLSKSPSGTSRS